jgi:hypothetical protein
MNLIGIDPLDFFEKWRLLKVNTFSEYFAQMHPAVRLRIASSRIPDFATRYPSLLTEPMTEYVGGWEIAFNWTGLPFRWTPLSPIESIGLSTTNPVILEVDAALDRRERSKSLVVKRREKWTAGRDLETVLEQLFGFR